MTGRFTRLRAVLPNRFIANLLQSGSPEPAAPWLSDAPPDLSTSKDAFGVEEIIDGLVETIAAARPPFTLSLSGSWGIGKSTVAEALVGRMRAKKMAAVLIDAWTEDVTTLRRSLIIAVAAAMVAKGDEKRELEIREDVAKLLDDAATTSKTEADAPKTKISALDTARAAFASPFTVLLLNRIDRRPASRARQR